MSVYAGPEIISDSLVLHLDAGSKRSYPGSGNTWIDLSGNRNNGNLTSNITFDANIVGSLVFTGNNYVTNFTNSISASGSRSVICFAQPKSNARIGLVSTRPSSAVGQTGWAFTVNRTSPGNLTYFHTGGSVLEIAAGITSNNWYQMAVTYDLTSATTILYVNGKQIGSPGTSFSVMTASTYNGVIGGDVDPLDPVGLLTTWQGNISYAQIYNRALSANEVKQNFNALRGRYGI